METSTFETPLMHVQHLTDLLIWATIGFSILSLAIVLWFLIRRPPIDLTTKLALLLGIFIFPILAAGSGNIAGFEATKTRDFCGGCHVMIPYNQDALDPDSLSLAAVHTRNKSFGEDSCYTCHADYTMFGAVITKMNGMTHAYHYYSEYVSLPLAETIGKIHLYKPYRNENCTQCHSTTLRGFLELEDHKGALEEIKAGKASCVSSGCHGYAHPFSKQKQEAAR